MMIVVVQEVMCGIDGMVLDIQYVCVVGFGGLLNVDYV